MDKAVFTEQFEKAFTIYQQVELLKKYLFELDITNIKSDIDNNKTNINNLSSEINTKLNYQLPSNFYGEGFIKWSNIGNEDDSSLDIYLKNSNSDSQINVSYTPSSIVNSCSQNDYDDITYGFENNKYYIKNDNNEGLFITFNSNYNSSLISLKTKDFYINLDNETEEFSIGSNVVKTVYSLDSGDLCYYMINNKLIVPILYDYTPGFGISGTFTQDQLDVMLYKGSFFVGSRRYVYMGYGQDENERLFSSIEMPGDDVSLTIETYTFNLNTFTYSKSISNYASRD